MSSPPTHAELPAGDVVRRVAAASAVLTAAERRVAQVVLDQPQLVGFGTVAELAEAAEVGAATVVRLAAKLDYDGFTAMQAAVRREMSKQLRPAAERIRETSSSPEIQSHLDHEVGNLQRTLLDASPQLTAMIAEHIADLKGHVLIISGDASAGVAQQFSNDLQALRPGVELLVGNEVSVIRRLAQCGAADTVVLVDLKRYDRWVVNAAKQAQGSGAWIVALTDSVLSPLSEAANATVVLHNSSPGPFDSHVATLALMNVIASGVAAALRSVASARLVAAEDAWNEAGILTER